jgi:hypothetical protein
MRGHLKSKLPDETQRNGTETIEDLNPTKPLLCYIYRG